MNKARMLVTTVYLEKLKVEEVEELLRRVIKTKPEMKKAITAVAKEIAEEKAREDFVRSF